MVNETELQWISGHCAVCLDNSIILFGGSYDAVDLLSTDVIWTYNLYTDKWEKHATSKRRVAPEPFEYAVAVTIEGTIYRFGGRRYDGDVATNDLWTLSRTETGGFTWSFIKYQSDKESPSPRYGHTGWQYAGKVWIFGGKGHLPQRYLHDHGDVEGVIVITNNQLLSYDPNTNKWINPQCFGEVPSPRTDHSSTIFREKVFLFGGYNENLGFLDDFLQLNMYSLKWTRIQTGQHRPEASCDCTLTATTDNQLVLRMPGSDTWIMDLASHSWRLYSSEEDHDRYDHAATLGLNSNVIIIGGYVEEWFDDSHEMHDIIFHVMLEPKCLQKLAVHTIYKHQANLSLKCLPKKLIALLGITGNKQGSASKPS